MCVESPLIEAEEVGAPTYKRNRLKIRWKVIWIGKDYGHNGFAYQKTGQHLKDSRYPCVTLQECSSAYAVRAELCQFKK